MEKKINIGGHDVTIICHLNARADRSPGGDQWHRLESKCCSNTSLVQSHEFLTSESITKNVDQFEKLLISYVVPKGPSKEEQELVEIGFAHSRREA